jgi:hypothetical protein
VIYKKRISKIHQKEPSLKSLLRQEFFEFFNEKSDRIGWEKSEAEDSLFSPDRAGQLSAESKAKLNQFLNEHNLTQEEFGKRYLIPSEERALQWTMLHLENLKGLPLEINSSFFEAEIDRFVVGNPESVKIKSLLNNKPYRQCFYCGKLDSDKRGKPFSKNKKNLIWFCHLSGCETGCNTNDHEEGCCWRSWNLLKRKHAIRLKRCTSDTDIIHIFQTLWETVYQHALTIPEEVRTLEFYSKYQ